MIYRSELYAPDLHKLFYKHVNSRVMAHSNGHDVPSDWFDKDDDDEQFGIYKRCGCMTHDECAIVFSIAKRVRDAESWLPFLDIGSHTLFTTCFLAEAGNQVTAVDPMYRVEEFENRAMMNGAAYKGKIKLFAGTSNEFFKQYDSKRKFAGVIIDGDHDSPCPLDDAKNAHSVLYDDGVIIFHDVSGKPVQDGIEWLISKGYNYRIYFTPHVVAVCWRGRFDPPSHTPDEKIKNLLCKPTKWRELVHKNSVAS